jgi:signal transduction histidine kinase
MRMATQHMTPAPDGFEEEYVSLLRDYAAGGGEAALGRVYELGRRAIAEQKSLVQITSLHHKGLQLLLEHEKGAQNRENLIDSCGEFLGECLSPYEMSHRGFQDAVNALRQVNEMLEQGIKRVAYAIHDEAGQLLVAVHLALAELARELPGPQQEKVRRVEGLLTEIEKQLRQYSHELRPTILDDLGWVPAIRSLAENASKRSSLPIHVETTVSGRLPGNIETALYRIVQEAINNAVKHANGRNIWIRAWQVRETLFCSVRDDGTGFNAGDAESALGRKGLGLIAMRERLSAIGGTLRIESAPGRGTELFIQIPLEEDDYANSNRARG